jgi:hypothetical protein
MNLVGKSAAIWRVVKVLLGAWAFAVGGVILLSLGLTIIVGPDWSSDNLRYASVILFLIGIPIIHKWLK